MGMLFAAGGYDLTEVTLMIAIIVVGALIGLVTLISGILRIKIFFAYWITNRERTSGGYTGAAAAEKMLEELGYNDIEVKQCGFIRALLFSNHYNPNKKTIYLRRSVYMGSHLTAVGIALQKVGLVVQDKRNEASCRRRWRLQKLALFGPLFFIPIVVVGIALDFTVLGEASQGIGFLVSAVLGAAFFIVSFVLCCLTMKVEKRANREMLEMMKNYDFLSPYEQEKVAKVFRTYELAYLCDFLIAILEIVRFILHIILSVYSASKKNS